MSCNGSTHKEFNSDSHKVKISVLLIGRKCNNLQFFHLMDLEYVVVMVSAIVNFMSTWMGHGVPRLNAVSGAARMCFRRRLATEMEDSEKLMGSPNVFGHHLVCWKPKWNKRWTSKEFIPFFSLIVWAGASLVTCRQNGTYLLTFPGFLESLDLGWTKSPSFLHLQTEGTDDGTFWPP